MIHDPTLLSLFPPLEEKISAEKDEAEGADRAEGTDGVETSPPTSTAEDKTEKQLRQEERDRLFFVQFELDNVTWLVFSTHHLATNVRSHASNAKSDRGTF